MPDDLIAELEAKRAAAALSNNKFAALLGITAAQWSRVRRRQQGAGKKLLAGVLRRYPSLVDAVHTELRDRPFVLPENGAGSTVVGTVSTDPEEPQV